jgi:hypothetical protein
MERLFTRAEAESLLPTLRPILEELQALRQQALQHDAELQQLHWKARGNGHDGLDDALTALQRRREEVVAGIGERVDRIRALGVQVKDLDAGLVDFPSRRRERVVLLCWKLGEPGIGWWHDLETGFAGRQALED